MKVTIVVDKPNSAIDRLSQPIKRYNPHLDIQILSLHPKRPSAEEIVEVVNAAKECDILHLAYWKSGLKLKEFFDYSQKRKILCHYNPYDAVNDLNQEFNAVVVGNGEIHSKIPYAHLIPYGINLEYWTYNENYTEDRTVCMVVARIEGKKGVKEVAQTCNELGYKFILVGRISDPNYFAEIMAANPSTDFREDISDEQLKEIYYQSAIHVCNSVDNFESGTLPILEAMACGVPVLARNVGHVPDIYDGGNMSIRHGQPEDLEDLKKSLSDLMDNPMLRSAMRDRAWDTVKNFNEQKMAVQFEKLYHKILKGEDQNKMPTVSVIIPTRNSFETLIQCISLAAVQDYPYFEIVVVDSSDEDHTSEIDILRKNFKIPIKYVYFTALPQEYSLAKARNLGIMHALGDLLVFCDTRIGMEQGAISAFVAGWRGKSWQWGIKDEFEKGFVENFSCVARKELIQYGMFNERIDCYGGQTQELRERLIGSIDFILCHKAKAKGIKRTSSKASKRANIIQSKMKIYRYYGI